MPDHVHMLAQPLSKGEGAWELGEVLHSVKGFSAHQIAKKWRRKVVGNHAQCADGTLIHGAVEPDSLSVYRVWQDERYDRWIRDEAEFAEKWQYIADNPVKNGLVAAAAEYRWLYVAEESPWRV